MNRSLLYNICWLFIWMILACPGVVSGQSYTVRIGSGIGIVDSPNFRSSIFLGRGMVVYPSQYDFSHMPNGAIFNKYAIILNDIVNGTISCNPTVVKFDSSTLCTIIPSAGYYIAMITDNGRDVTANVAGKLYVLNNITFAHTISATFGKLGDFNNDGNVDLIDAVIALQVMSGVSSATQTLYSRAEIIGDGKIGLADAVYILQKAAGLRIESPIGMVLIPAGSFQMGDTAGEGLSDERPVHTVTVSAFYMDKYEVTKALWDEVYTWATANGYTFDNAGSGSAATYPVQNVMWYDVVKWLNARSEKEGRTPVYYTDVAQTIIYKTGQENLVNAMVKWTVNGYRLPTEAEWEYAIRAGTTTRFYTGDCITTDQANFDGNKPWSGCPTGQYRGSTTPVGTFAPNPWGLYDMAGNVFEMIWDHYWGSTYPSGSVTNPHGSNSGTSRIMRGGDFGLYFDGFGVVTGYASMLRSSYRTELIPTAVSPEAGFRSVLNQP